jgi:VWFA-related protein
VIFVVFVILVPERQPWRVAAQTPQPGQPTQAQQRPVFRGGTHFVRVDAYPVQNGRILEGLAPGDFEILEDGKPQAIESFDFVTFDTFTPEAERRDPQTQQEGFDLAGDPRYRVFVIFVDLAFSNTGGVFVDRTTLDSVESPLVGFLDRVLGPQDLFGLLTSRNSVKDLVLARKTTVTRAQIEQLWQTAEIGRDDADEIDRCGCGTGAAAQSLEACRAMLVQVKRRHRADGTYATLHDLVAQLGAIRQERKNVIFVSNLLPREREARDLIGAFGPAIPMAGILNGRPTLDNTDTRAGGAGTRFCSAEFQRLANIDFNQRYLDLLAQARNENVSFYVVSPAGLQASMGIARANEDLKSLASETGGLAIVNTNDLNGGLKRIADDLAAYYVLGYYTTNTKFDGGIRRISVRLKSSGQTIRARREYRAPTEAEIAAMASPAPRAASAPAATSTTHATRDAALTLLEHGSRPFASYAAVAGKSVTVVAELSAASIQAGRWKDGADVEVRAFGAADDLLASARGRLDAGASSVAIPLAFTGAWPERLSLTMRGEDGAPATDSMKVRAPSGSLVGEPVAYRSAPRLLARPVAGFAFARSERIRVEWPVLAPLDRRDVHLLDRNGTPLAIEVPLSEDAARNCLVLDMPLSALSRADYLIELTAGSGATMERRLLAIRMR